MILQAGCLISGFPIGRFAVSKENKSLAVESLPRIATSENRTIEATRPARRSAGKGSTAPSENMVGCHAGGVRPARVHRTMLKYILQFRRALLK